MKGKCCLKVLGAVILSSIFTGTCVAGSSASYTCYGMDSKGDKLSPKLTLTPTDKSDVLKSVWTYDKAGSPPDMGVVNVVGKNRMVELSKNDKGVAIGQADLYQVSDKQILLSFVSSDQPDNPKNVLVCNLVE